MLDLMICSALPVSIVLLACLSLLTLLCFRCSVVRGLSWLASGWLACFEGYAFLACLLGLLSCLDSCCAFGGFAGLTWLCLLARLVHHVVPPRSAPTIVGFACSVAFRPLKASYGKRVFRPA